MELVDDFRIRSESCRQRIKPMKLLHCTNWIGRTILRSSEGEKLDENEAALAGCARETG
jgi:hypothetical protein